VDFRSVFRSSAGWTTEGRLAVFRADAARAPAALRASSLRKSNDWDMEQERTEQKQTPLRVLRVLLFASFV
jgi:hypothetical protein